MKDQKPKVNDVINDMHSAGKELKELWNETKDLKVIQTSIQAYNAAVSAAKATVVYKKLTGKPSQVEFFENGSDGSD